MVGYRHSQKWLKTLVVLATLASLLQAATAALPTLPPNSTPVTLQPGQKVFPYFNPVYPGDAPDPAVLRVGDSIYAAVTGGNIYRSHDMADWERVGSMFAAGLPAWVDTNAPDIWAPDLNYINGKYVLYFSARAKGYSSIHRGVGVAWANNPVGPYFPTDKPLAVGPGFRNIDPMAFLDDNGKRYLYWGSEFQPILVQELAPDGLSLVGQPKPALYPNPGIRYSRLVEGTWVIKRADYYYLFWSGDGYMPGEYAVSVARSTSPFGPFEHYAGNPILQENPWWTSPGHNALIQDDAGQDWLFYHAYDTSDTRLGRMLCIDKLVWKNGWPQIAGRVPSSVPILDGPVWNNTVIPTMEVAFKKEVTASSVQDGKTAQAVVDGNTYSGWLPDANDQAAWLMVDLGALYRITKVELRFRGLALSYLVETSPDKVHWETWADYTKRYAPNSNAMRNEATTRFVRIKQIQAPPGSDATLYDMRVSAYQNVWLENPTTLTTAAGEPLRIHVNPNMKINSVTVSVDGVTLYKGAQVPLDAVSELNLPDGLHQLVLTVVDQNEAIWQHAVKLNIKSTEIKRPLPGEKLQGKVQLDVSTSYNPLQQASVLLMPLVEGETQVHAAKILYQGTQVPTNLEFDTLSVPDGAYTLQFVATHADGNVSQSSVAVRVVNWDVLTDEFVLPSVAGWFGAVDRKKTSFESAGWDYVSQDADAVFSDTNRRVWLGNGEGQLVWESPLLHKFTVTLYTKDAVFPSLSVATAPDQQQWQSRPYNVEITGKSPAGWTRWTVTGQIPDMATRFIRISLSGTQASDNVQLGSVELVSHAQ